MTTYLLSFIATALVIVLCKMLSPDGERDGLAKHLRLLTALLLVVSLLSPIWALIDGAQKLVSGEIELPWENTTSSEDYSEELQSVLDSASAAYFSDMLTQTIEKNFDISRGEIRCAIQWERQGESLSPGRVTVILSGSAIWKDPAEIEQFVTALLGCTCVSAIE